MEIKKEDWESLKKQLENQHKNMLMALKQDEVLLKFVDDQLATYPDEDKEMKEEIKEDLGLK